MIVRAFQPEDYARITLQPSQLYLKGYMTEAMIAELATPESFTAEHDGVVLGIGGVYPIWENYASAWAMVAEEAGAHFAAIHKATRRFLDVVPYRRIEAEAVVGFDRGRRWLEMLGFRCETPEPMEAYLPDGRGAYLYSKVR